MPFDYARTAATAQRLLDKFGQTMTLRRTTSGNYVPGSGIFNTTHDYSCIGAVLDYQQRDIDGTLIKVGDRRVLIGPAVAVEPNPGDVVLFKNGSRLNIISAKQVAPSGMVVLHEVQGRG